MPNAAKDKGRRKLRKPPSAAAKGIVGFENIRQETIADPWQMQWDERGCAFVYLRIAVVHGSPC